MRINPFENITVEDMSSLSTVKRSKGETILVKNRFAHAVSFCLSGKITYTMGGKRYVSDPQHAILLPQGQSYTLHCDESGEFPVINFYATERFCPNEFFTVNLSNPAPYISDYGELQHLALLKKSDSRIRSLSVFYGILSRLAVETQNRDINPFLATALMHIEENLANPEFDISTLSKISNASEVYLRKLFNRTFKVSPKQYLTDLRLAKAKQLLKNSSTSVTKIAEDCGYSSIYHFSRAFKSATGYTPTEYRAQQSKMLL